MVDNWVDRVDNERMLNTQTYSPWFRIRVAMALGLMIGAVLSVWSSIASVLVTAGLTAVAFGLVMAIVIVIERRKLQKSRPVSEPISHVKVR